MGVDRPWHMSYEKKTSYFPLYWMVNRDPYNGLLQSLYNWVGHHPLYIYNPTNKGFVHCSHMLFVGFCFQLHGLVCGKKTCSDVLPLKNVMNLKTHKKNTL